MLEYLALACMSVTYVRYLKLNEFRTDVREINDPLFKILPHFDASWPVALMLWINTVMFVVNMWTDWNQLNLQEYCWSFLNLMVLRMLVLYIHPLEGPSSMIPLRDPMIDTILGVSEPLQRDLAFSGHVGTMTMMGYLSPQYFDWIWILAVCTAICLVSSHVHYSYDCGAAPAFAYFAHHNWSTVASVWYRMSTSMQLFMCFIILYMGYWWHTLILQHHLRHRYPPVDHERIDTLEHNQQDHEEPLCETSPHDASPSVSLQHPHEL